MLNLPVFKAAAVQTAPVFLDTDATIDKACALIAEAARNGATLVVFPEVFVAGYPYWNWIMTPVQGSPWFEKLCRSAIEIPGPEVDRLTKAARDNAINVVIGVNERSATGIGTLYNTVLTISAEGKQLGRHRKLVPTWAEKLTWANGDASSLRVHKTSVGPLGALACGENTNTLARFALLAQGELVHAACYISLPVAPPDYDMAEAIKVRAAAHSFEGKVFNIVSSAVLDNSTLDSLQDLGKEALETLEQSPQAVSMFIGPSGEVISDTLCESEGLLYQDIDIAQCVEPKQFHDVVGYYNRFDVFELKVRRKRLSPIQLLDVAAAPADNLSEDQAD